MIRLHPMTDRDYMGLLDEAPRGDGHRGLTAATSVDNPGAQRVLEKNGFVPSGTRDDPEDGPLNLWAIDLTTDGRP